MILKSGELTIRFAEVTDAATLAGWWNDGAVMAHAGFPYGLNTTAEEIAKSLKTDGDKRRRFIME